MPTEEPAPSQRPVPSGAVGCWSWHPPTGALRWDEACRRLFGALPHESALQAWRRIVHPADQSRLHRPGRTPEEVLTLRVRDGQGHRYLLTRTTHVDDGTDGTEGCGGWVSGVMVDITAARDADLRAAAALESMAFAFLAVDTAFRITYLNHAAEVLIGRRFDELAGHVIWERSPHLAGTVLEQSYRRAMATGQTTSFDVPGATEGSRINAEVHPRADGFDVFLRDSTEEHRATAEQRRLVAELEHQATHDPLTGLPNIAFAARRAAAHLAGAPAATVAIVSFDLDRFGLVNDTLGRSVGDELLRELAVRLREVDSHDTLVLRCEGDEFAAVLLDPSAAQVDAVAQQVLAVVREPLRVGRQEVHLTASAGLSVGRPGPGVELDAFMYGLVREADIALHAAKRTGRDRAVWCDAALRADVDHRTGVERDLRQALHPGQDQLRLHYQPSFSLASGAPTGVEALLRWQHPVRGAVSPAEVIPVAEDSGLVVPLGEWVVATAAAQAARWRQVPDFTTWFNVAPRQLVAGDVPSALRRALASTGLAPHRLGVEVTESVLADGSPAGAALAEIHGLGVRIAIDDFGTGYSSLSRLLAFPVDLLKIDRSFVLASGTPAGAAVIGGIVDLAHGLGARVVAEGVETWEELAVVRSTACDAVCGFLLGRPVAAADQRLQRARLSPPREGPAPRTPRPDRLAPLAQGAAHR